MDQNYSGPRWDRVGLAALIMFFSIFVVYFGGEMIEDALGPIGKPLLWVVVLVIIAAIGLAGAQMMGVAFYRTGVQHGTVATTQGIDAAVDALASDNDLDIQKLKVLMAAMKPSQQAHLTDEKLRLEAQKLGIKLEGKQADHELRLKYNDQARQQRQGWQEQEQAQRQEQDAAANQRYAEFDDAADDETVEFSQYGNQDFWNGDG